jgi:hypothetical protein
MRVRRARRLAAVGLNRARVMRNARHQKFLKGVVAEPTD